mgnify:CR=1 FL=1
MALIARFLIDTSAAARMRHPVVAARLSPLIEAGVVATCATLDSEALYTARSPTEYEQLRSDRRHAYEYRPTIGIGTRPSTPNASSPGPAGIAPLGSPTCSAQYSPASTGSLWCTMTPTSTSPPKCSR